FPPLPPRLARSHQGRQSRPRPGGAGPTAAGKRAPGWPEARRCLGAGSTVQRNGRANHCARPAPPRAAVVTVIELLDIGLAVLVLAVATWTITAPVAFARGLAVLAYGMLVSRGSCPLVAPDVGRHHRLLLLV